MELVSEIRVQAKGANGAVECGAGRFPVRINEIAVVAVKQFRAPGEALELIVTQRLVAQHQVCSQQDGASVR